MSKTKDIKDILNKNQVIEAIIQAVSNTLSIEQDAAKEFVERRLDKAINKVGKDLTEGKYRIREGDLNTKLSDMSVEEILNNESILKDK